jgi:hypothetical protein
MIKNTPNKISEGSFFILTSSSNGEDELHHRFTQHRISRGASCLLKNPFKDQLYPLATAPVIKEEAS